MSNKAIVIAVAIVGVIALVGLTLQFWVKHKIRTTIERNMAGMGADVSLGRIGVNLPTRTLTLHNIRITAGRNDPQVNPDGGLVSFDVELPLVRATDIKLKPLGAGSVIVEVSRGSISTASRDRHALAEIFGGKIDVEDMVTGRFSADSIVLGFGTGESDKNHITLRELVCKGIDATRLIASERTLVVDSVLVGGAQVKSSKNRQISEAPRTKPLLWQTIQRLPLPVDIATVIFVDADIEYDELSATGDHPGVVTLVDMKGTATNLTNISEGHDRFFRVDLHTSLMGRGGLDATCLFPVDSMDNHWEVKGRLGGMELTAMNPALEPLGNINVKSGNLQSLDFNIVGSSARSQVRLTMLYDDLDVELLRKHDHTHPLGLPTLILNDFVLRHANPAHPDAETREGTGTHEHDPSRSTFNFIWRSIFPGITRTVL